MKPIFITVDHELKLMVIPDSVAHQDGHPVLTYSYSIYKDDDSSTLADKESQLHLEKHNDPNYMGVIIFEQPDKLFTYTADGQTDLTSDEVQEVIEKITHYRDKPAMWII